MGRESSSGGSGAGVTLALGPGPSLLSERRQLGEQYLGRRFGALERVDPLQPGQHRTRLLHPPSVSDGT